MKKTVKVVLRAFFALALISSVGFLSWRATAAGSPLTVTAASIAAKSDGVMADISGFQDNEITNDVTFNKIGDSVTYSLEIKNTSDGKLTIKTITDDNSSRLVEYSYDTVGFELAAGESFKFTPKVTYRKAVADTSKRKQAFTATFSFAYQTESGEEGTSAVVITPNTGDPIVNFVIIFTASLVGLMLSIFFIRSANKKVKTVGVIIAAVVAAALVIPAAVKADDDISPIKFKNSYALMDRVIVTYNDGTADRTTEIANGDTIELDDLEIPGYIFGGWEDEEGNEFDFDQPITGDITIYPVLEPIGYTIEIDTDDDGWTDVTVPAVYGEPVELPDNEVDPSLWPGYLPDGWTDGDNHYNDGEEVSNLTDIDGDVVYIWPDWRPIHYTLEIDTDGDGDADESVELAYGDDYELPTNTATSAVPGYEPSGWTDGTNHYDDEEVIYDLTTEDGDVITIVPDWTQTLYILTLNVGDGWIDESQIEGVYNEEINLPDPYEPYGQKFLGWFTEEVNGEKVSSPYILTGSTELFAHYRERAAEATFESSSYVGQIMKNINENIVSFRRYWEDPQPDDDYTGYTVVSEPDSPGKIYLWQSPDDENTIFWWTEANKVYLSRYGSSMFNGFSKLQNIDIFDVDISKTGSLASFFAYTAIKTINLSSWNTSNVTNMANMFAGCSNLTTVTFGNNFDTSKVTNLSGFFDGATSLHSVDMSMFNTEKLKDASFMFRGAGFETLDLSSFSTSALEKMHYMFYGNTRLTTIYVNENFDVSHVTGSHPTSGQLYYDSIFSNDALLVGGAGTAYNVSNPIDKTYARIDDPDNGKPGYLTLKNKRYVRFDANGGEGTMASVYMSTKTAENLPANTYTKLDRPFLSWNAKANGSGTTYGDQGKLKNLSFSKTPFVLYAQWEADVVVTNSGIYYSGNGATAGSMDKQDAANGKTVGLWAPNFSRTGYAFAGWSTTRDDSGDLYGPNEMITMPATGGLSFYARWIKPANENATFQKFDKDAEPYASLEIGSALALYDERDGQAYLVAKMTDGKWHMSDNLRLDLTNENTTITAENTNHPTAAFLTGISAIDAESPFVYCSGSSAECFDRISYDPAFVRYSKEMSYENVMFGADQSKYPQVAFQYGSLYNWYTATAGNGVYAIPGGTDVTAGDLCPSGWHLPTSSDNLNWLHSTGVEGDYITGSKNKELVWAWFKYPINITNSGLRTANSANSPNKGYNSQGVAAYLITSTTRVGVNPSPSINQYYQEMNMYFNTIDLNLGTSLHANTYGWGKSTAMVMRCIAK